MKNNSYANTSLLVMLAAAILVSGFFVANSAQAAILDVPGTYSTIQAAVDAAVDGDTINVAVGTYAENVLLNGKTNLTIQGAGVSTVVEPASGIGFAVTNSNGLTIKNLKIHTTDPVSTGSGAHGIWVAGTPNNGTAVTGLTIQDDTIVVDGYSTGIYAEWVDTAPHSGWLIGGSGHGNIIEINSGTGTTGDGMDLYDVSGSEISYNTITLTNPTESTPVIWSSELSNLTGLTFANNTVSGSGGSEVWIGTDFSTQAPDTTVSTVSVTGNTFSNWGARALKLNGSVSDITVGANTFQMTTDTNEVIGGTATDKTGNGNTFNVNSPAKIQKAINSAFSGDTINVAAGIYSEPIDTRAECGNESASICVYKSLILHGETGAILDGTGLGNGSAIALSRNGYTNDSNLAISNVTIEGLEIRNYSNPGNNGGIGSGIIAWNTKASNITIQNNNIHDVGWDGVLVGSDNNTVQSGWTISGNTFSNVPEIAIELTNVTDSNITNNIITAPANLTWDTPPDAGVGIEVAVRNRVDGLSAGSNVVVSGNTISGTFPMGSRAGINILARTYSSASAPGVLDGVAIENNSITDIGITGISIASEQRTDIITDSVISNLTISGNTITGNATGMRLGFVPGNPGADGTYDSTIVLSDKNKVSGNTTAVENTVTGFTISATNNYWGAASGPVASAIYGDVSYRPWLLEANGDTYDQTIALTEAGQWALVSAPQLLSELPTIKDDGDGIVTTLAYVNGSFAAPTTDNAAGSDVKKPVSAFYVKPTNKAGIGFNYDNSATGPVTKVLSSGWNLIGTNHNDAAVQDELSVIQHTEQSAGMLTLYVPDIYNARKDFDFEEWGSDANHNLNAYPFIGLQNNPISSYDGYWVNMSVAMDYSQIQ